MATSQSYTLPLNAPLRCPLCYPSLPLRYPFATPLLPLRYPSSSPLPSAELSLVLHSLFSFSQRVSYPPEMLPFQSAGNPLKTLLCCTLCYPSPPLRSPLATPSLPPRSPPPPPPPQGFKGGFKRGNIAFKRIFFGRIILR